MDVSYILDNYDKYEQMLAKRYMPVDLLQNIKILHQEYVCELFKYEKLGNLRNKLTSAIKKNKYDGSSKIKFELDTNLDTLLSYLDDDLELYSRDDIIEFGKCVKLAINKQEQHVNGLFNDRNELVNKMPNLISDDVPISNDEDQNKVLSVYNHNDVSEFSTSIRTSKTQKYDQYELCLKLCIIEDASHLSGNRGYFLTGAGVRLNYALLNYAMDFITNIGYKLMYTPHFMNKQNMTSVCQLSEFNETLYELKDENKFLIATSEQPLTAYFEGKTLQNMPIKMAGISTCYRKETGAHGKDTLGIFRVHQFEKIEQFCVTEPNESWTMMSNMIDIAQDFYKSLGLSYRVISIVSGALNNAAAMKYDIEGWFPGSGKYRELVSCSNTTDYFSRRLKVKTPSKAFAHMLNSTLCANTRTLCCILESYQTEDGINVPEVLQKYMSQTTLNFL